MSPASSMISGKECPKVYGVDEYDLHRVFISTGYYGTCTRCDSSLGSKYIATTPSAPTEIQLDERTPLLPAYKPARTWRHINIRIFSLGVLFIGGMTVGSYLLYEQGKPRPIHHMLEMISREEWGARSLPTGDRLVDSDVAYLLVYQTGDRNCFNSTDCFRLLKHMQSDISERDKRQQQEIPFNFLIGGDGRIYEGRGWFTESGNSPIRKDKVLSIAFIGNFTKDKPSERQLNGAMALLEDIEYKRRFAPSYRVVGIRDFARSKHDGDALFASIAEWKRWDQTISIF